MLTTFNTVFGRYRFLKQPFAIISVQDEFQRQVDETCEGLDSIAGTVDDILMFAGTRPTPLDCTRERGVRLNPDKCVSEVSDFGYTLSSEGTKPDPQKMNAVKEMRPPQSDGELETILRMVNYLSRFAPYLSEVNAQLLRQDSEFVWDTNHDKAFQAMKDLITQQPGAVLAYFNPQKELRLHVDASKSGHGAAMLQDDKSVAYTSKSLNGTEENNAQIAKEPYAVLFGCKRFHEYMYGRRVVVESDHKPLVAILRYASSVNRRTTTDQPNLCFTCLREHQSASSRMTDPGNLQQ